MFTQIQPGGSASAARAWTLSLALHGLFLLWLLHGFAPRFLAPSSVVHGDGGQFVADVYWPNQKPGTSRDGVAGNPAVAPRRETAAKGRLPFAQQSNVKRKVNRVQPQVAYSEIAASGQLQEPRPAGAPYGTAFDGQFSGDEVRPALPLFSPDPFVEASELPAGVKEGDEIVEITIDVLGNIIQKNVIASLGPTIDNKVLAALDNWHFRPATRFGVPVPSKQDVHYHFPRMSRG